MDKKTTRRNENISWNTQLFNVSKTDKKLNRPTTHKLIESVIQNLPKEKILGQWSFNAEFY